MPAGQSGARRTRPDAPALLNTGFGRGGRLRPVHLFRRDTACRVDAERRQARERRADAWPNQGVAGDVGGGGWRRGQQAPNELGAEGNPGLGTPSGPRSSTLRPTRILIRDNCRVRSNIPPSRHFALGQLDWGAWTSDCIASLIKTRPGGSGKLLN